MKSSFYSHLRVLVIYLLAVSVLRGVIPHNILMVLDLIGLWIGGLLGFLLLDLDRLINVYIERPQEQLSLEVRQLVSRQQWKAAANMLFMRRREQSHLAFRNGVFGVIFLGVVFFAFTSAANLFGKGLAAGVMIHFLYDAWRDSMRDPERFVSWFGWMVQRELALKQQRMILYLMTGTFALFTLLIL
jgi:hypothetical protein